jgi:hypothetical protein
MQQENRKVHAMKTSPRYGKPLVIACQASEASHPSMWQQDKAARVLGLFDDFQRDAVVDVV